MFDTPLTEEVKAFLMVSYAEEMEVVEIMATTADNNHPMMLGIKRIDEMGVDAISTIGIWMEGQDKTAIVEALVEMDPVEDKETLRTGTTRITATAVVTGIVLTAEIDKIVNEESLSLNSRRRSLLMIISTLKNPMRN
jgi:hypothetical protein